jgi:cellulose biosynthesis protein BcsQ
VTENIPPICRIALFNHKGGVGKTTLIVQIAHAMTLAGRRVLLVDADPQCNLTSYLVEESVVNDLLNNSESPQGRTIWSGLKPVVDGLGDIRVVDPYPTPYGFSLLPGDVLLATFERELDGFWSDALLRKPRGFMGSTALSRLATEAGKRVNADVILFDVGPNIGALNRAVILDVSGYAVPTACDVFSVRAIATLGRTIEKWVHEWRMIEKLAPRDAPLLRGVPGFLGYITQQFKTYRNQMSSVFADFVPKLETAIRVDMIPLLQRVDRRLVRTTGNELQLGAIREFTSLVTRAQDEGKPLAALDGIPPAQKEEITELFDQIAERILGRACE